MKGYDIYGVGNALVDSEYEVTNAFLEAAGLSKGMMTLVEEGERKHLISLLEEEYDYQVIKQAGGGSAANTMIIVSQLGGDAFYSCKVANDRIGDFFVRDLVEAGVDTNLSSYREAGNTGQCISMITPDAERTMTTCLGITNFLSPAELNPDALRRSNKLYIEGYLMSSATGFEAAIEAQTIAKSARVEVSLTLSDPAMVENYLPNYRSILDSGVDLLFCNLDEAKLLTGTETPDDCVRQLRNICSCFVITCGKEGSLAFDGNSTIRTEGKAAKAIDTTGAGDIFAGTFLHGICNGKDFTQAAEFANRSASLLVANFGARLKQSEVDRYLKI
ncbi:MAG TPA: adenosine kinase [Gammaproteobacteria bacterium]|nr:adenosine kinase [Gammaproteobacteria bacterium]